MSFLRESPRKLKSATQIDAINRVLEKYIDFKELFLQINFITEPVRFLERPEDDILILHFNKPLENEQIEIYTIIRERFIIFNLEMVSMADPQYPDYSYCMRIEKCSIAMDKREYERIAFLNTFPLATNISTIKIQELENDFRKSLSVRMIVEEYINKMEGVDIKKVHYKDDKDLSPVVRYVIESGMNLHIPDTSALTHFFEETEKYFERTNSIDLQDELKLWLQNNSASIKSLLVRPVIYHPLIGQDFPIAYLTAFNRDSPIDENRIAYIDSFINDLSERVRNGNLIESKTEGKIIDVSAGGAKIELLDAKIIEKLISQRIVVFDMNLKEDNPLIVSGRVVWVYQHEGGAYTAGIDFKGSKFGPALKNALSIHIKNFLSRSEHQREHYQ